MAFAGSIGVGRSPRPCGAERRGDLPRGFATPSWRRTDRFLALAAGSVIESSRMPGTDECERSWCYSVRDGQLLSLESSAEKPVALAVLVHSQFRAMLTSPAFPCLGGSGAVHRSEYRFGLYGELGSSEAAQRCSADLAAYLTERPSEHYPVTVFVASFREPIISSELAFETALWRHLCGLQHLDPPERDGRAPGCPFGGSSGGAADPDPGFFFQDREFFVVGLHPASSRWARRFGWPTLVFNALTHSDELKRLGKYDHMQEKILARDRGLQGSDNPSLPFPQVSQFSGRAVDSTWKCPVHLD